MQEPIKAGDLAVVIDGVLGQQSPNIGLIVKVLQRVGEHSKYGIIWRCEAEYAELSQQGVDVGSGVADFAQTWLRKITPPDTFKTEDRMKELETHD